MRLIDGEALKEKFKEHYDLFVSTYKNEQDMSVADKSRVDEILNSMAEVINAPTVCDLEQIRDEIEQERDKVYQNRQGCDTYYADGLDTALDIFDKYTKGE